MPAVRHSRTIDNRVCKTKLKDSDLLPADARFIEALHAVRQSRDANNLEDLDMVLLLDEILKIWVSKTVDNSLFDDWMKIWLVVSTNLFIKPSLTVTRSETSRLQFRPMRESHRVYPSTS